MDLAIIKDSETFFGMGDEWNRLLMRSSSVSTYLTHEWLSAWFNNYEKKNHLMIILAKEEGRIIGAAPLMIVKSSFRGLPITKLTFIGDSNWTVGDFIISEERESVLKEIMDNLYNEAWDIIDLQGIPEDSPNLKILKDIAGAKGTDYTSAPASVCPFLKIDLPWEDFYNSRSFSFKKSLRNKLNRIKKAGDVTVRRYSSKKEVAEILPVIFKIGLKGWKHKINNAISSTQENRAFYSALSEAMSVKGLLDIWLLSLNDIPIAFEYHLRYNGKVCALVADYDESYKELSPGSVLDYNIIEYMFRNERCEYDMGSGNSFYKQNWTKDAKKTVRLSFYKQNLYGKMLHFIESRIVPAARVIMDNFKRLSKSESA